MIKDPTLCFRDILKKRIKMKLIKGEESFYCKQLHLKTEGYVSDFKNKTRLTKERKPFKSINQNDVFDVSLVGPGVFFII